MAALSDHICSRLKSVRDFIWMLRHHEEGILASFDLRLDNGIVEAPNNNTKAISHRPRGYRSENTFSVALFHVLGQRQLSKNQHRFL